jgi:glycosyltransferase involved in cell wall biosynthesis
MQITISSGGGTYRTASLAKKLAERGMLRNFFVPFVKDPGSFPERVLVMNSALFWGKLFWDRSRLGRFFDLDARYLYCDLQDRFVAPRLSPSADVVFAESVMALNTIRRAKELHMTTVIDRTNSHIEFQSELMREEYSRYGAKGRYNSPAVIEKSLQEYAEADYISVLSSFVKRTFLQKGISEGKLLHIPSGIEMDLFHKVPKDDDVFRVVYCGGLCLKKGVHYLLQAFRELKLKNAELLLIGRVLPDFEPMATKHSGEFKQIAHVPRKAMHRFYSQGSVFVLPSLEEGLAKVMLEAMACGLPVVATENTGAEDVLRNGVDGFVIPIRDVEAIKDKILFFYENREKIEEMSRSAAAHVRQRFSEEAYADRFIDAMERASAGKPPMKALH